MGRTQFSVVEIKYLWVRLPHRQGESLAPASISWPAWRTFVEQLDTEHIYPHIKPRFHHSELHPIRLSKVYPSRRFQWLRKQELDFGSQETKSSLHYVRFYFLLR